MKKIKLNRGCFAKVDDSYFELLNQYKWSVLKANNTNYAQGFVKGERVLMHRLLLNYPKCSDHINGDGLDNQMLNLRECSYKQNMGNRRKLGKFTSIYKGVYWQKDKKKWRTKITKGTATSFHLGYFDNEKDAAKAYDAAALEYFGEFAKTNFK